MEFNGCNFDSTVGGTERLPHSANSLKFTASRSIEIAAMVESILRPSKTKLIFQTLPVHMRRRVMSHNCKRLPRKLREGHFEQLKKSGLPPKQKRPSRKYRRRPTNLLDEYQRRQKTQKWLESHVWHAKRFHMAARWGYRLPYAPCDKAFRACYRATSAHCLLQDISFYECLQITGDITHIESTLKPMTRPHVGLGVCARAQISGARAGFAHMYKPDMATGGYIGKVDFLWKPEDNNEANRTLWLFVHPSFYRELYETILNAFSIQSDHDYTVPEKRRKLNFEVANDCVKITELNGQLNRFRLTGPKSQAVLTRALQLIPDMNTISSDTWLTLHCKNFDLKLKEKSSYWESIRNVSSPGELPARLVFGAVVRDPRLVRPYERSKAQKQQYSLTPARVLINIPRHAAESPLWDLSILQEIQRKRWSDHRLIEYATERQLVPGEVDVSNPDVQSVPIILIQRPGSQDPSFKKLGYGSGWDVIIPAGYSLTFWCSFIMLGGRAGGLRETESVARESGECYLPPDSAAGKEEEQRIYKEMRDKYFRLPPNKRVNYTKLGINSPFLCRWDVLTAEWSENATDINVLRNRQFLNIIQDSLRNKKLTVEPNTLGPCLVPVFVKVTGKGNLRAHAVICLPYDADLKNVNTVFEPCHKDPFEKERKRLRENNRTKLTKLRQQRVKIKRSGLKVAKVEPSQTSQALSEFTVKMRELWLPTHVNTVRRSCSREVMGYVTAGGFSYTEARSTGVGYVAVGGLQRLAAIGVNEVLVRNTTSRTYRVATISVIVNQ